MTSLVRKFDGKVVQTRNYHYTNSNGDRIVIQEHGMGHSTAMPGAGREPHFNVRPITKYRQLPWYLWTL